MSIADAFAGTEARDRARIQEATFGHLAPEKNRTYNGKIVYAVGCFGCDASNPTAIFCEFEDLESSPWFYEALLDFMRSRNGTEGCVYEFIGTFRNYKFRGKVNLVYKAMEQ